MACSNPFVRWKSKKPNPITGKYLIFASPGNKTSEWEPISLPCGKCPGCLMQRSRQWSMRCMLEASLWTRNCFITLTYSPQYLPPNGSLVKKHFTLFMKRLRKKYGDGIRFFQCGEYGSKGLRPHYHACLFNFDFDDKYLWRKSDSGALLYRSPSLEKLWPYGFSTIGDVTEKSAAYVARYVLKKYDEEYRSIPLPDGCIPSYVNMSRRPGIAHDWFMKYWKDVYPLDLVVLDDNFKMLPPRYFDSLLEKIDSELMLLIREKRKRFALDNLCRLYPEDVEEIRYGYLPKSHLDRLKVEEQVLRLRINKLKRGYEIES